MTRSRPDQTGLAYAYRVLANTALAIGTATLLLAIALALLDTGQPLPLFGTTLIAGLTAIAASTLHTKYETHDE